MRSISDAAKAIISLQITVLYCHSNLVFSLSNYCQRRRIICMNKNLIDQSETSMHRFMYCMLANQAAKRQCVHKKQGQLYGTLALCLTKWLLIFCQFSVQADHIFLHTSFISNVTILKPADFVRWNQKMSHWKN